MNEPKNCQFLRSTRPRQFHTKEGTELARGGFICGEVHKRTGYYVGVDADICETCDEALIDRLCKTTIRIKDGIKEEPFEALSKVTLAKNFGRAILRWAKGGFGKVNGEVFIERHFCCTTCGATKRCPYCGCYLNNERFSKSVLATEAGCPNPETYPDLPTYPPRNYWQVCDESTTLIIPARCEPDLNRTLKNLLTNASGKIEIIVILDGYDYKVLNSDKIHIIKHSEPLGRRVSINEAGHIATGDYLFILDGHCTMGEGFDTKLKCACVEDSIVTCLMQALDPTTWELLENAKIGAFTYLDANFFEYFGSSPKPFADWKVIEETSTFRGNAFMLRRSLFEELGGYDEKLGKYGFDGAELTLKLLLGRKPAGRILLRTDLICGHLYHEHKDERYTSKGLEPSAFTFGQWRNYVLAKYGQSALIYTTPYQDSKTSGL